MNYLLLFTALNVQVVFPDQVTCENAKATALEQQVGYDHREMEESVNHEKHNIVTLAKNNILCIPLGKDYIHSRTMRHVVQPLVTSGAIIHED